MPASPALWALRLLLRLLDSIPAMGIATEFLLQLIMAAGVAAAANAVMVQLVRRGAPTASQRKAIEDEIGPALEEALAAPPEPEQSLRPTSAGELAVQTIMKAYVKDLTAEASRIARRFGSDSPSPVHVGEAASRIGILRSRTSAWTDIVLGLGSLLIGAALAYQINLWTGGAPAKDSGLVMAAVFGVGMGLFVAAATLKVTNR